MKKIIGIAAGTLLVLGILIAPGQVEGVTRKACQDQGLLAVCANPPCAETEWTCQTAEDRVGATDQTTVTQVDDVTDFQTLLQSIVGWVQVFFYIVATLMIILAAWDYLSSGGSEEKVTAARQKVIYALVAIAIAVIAGGVVSLVRNFVN